jgi:hypothetical protein
MLFSVVSITVKGRGQLQRAQPLLLTTLKTLNSGTCAAPGPVEDFNLRLAAMASFSERPRQLVDLTASWKNFIPVPVESSAAWYLATQKFCNKEPAAPNQQPQTVVVRVLEALRNGFLGINLQELATLGENMAPAPTPAIWRWLESEALRLKFDCSKEWKEHDVFLKKVLTGEGFGGAGTQENRLWQAMVRWWSTLKIIGYTPTNI